MSRNPPESGDRGSASGTEAAARTANPVLRELRRDAQEIFRSALDRVNPSEAVANALRFQDDSLVVSGRPLPMAPGNAVRVLAIGKGSLRMLEGALGVLRAASGLIVTHEGMSSPPTGFEVIRGSHPLPDEGSLMAGEAALRLVEGLRPGDLLLVLISGGASALFEASLVPLQDLRTAYSELLRSGLGIRDVNEVRKGLSQVKGGRLAERARARDATVVGLILSDIVGNPIDDIGSGPTALDSSRGERGKEILVAHRMWDSMPASVRRCLETAARERGAVRHPLPGVHNVIVGDNSLACRAARQEAERRSYAVHVLTTFMEGEARRVGPSLAFEALQWSPRARSVALIAGGETTVTVRGDGKGGRNQELALSTAEILDGHDAVLLACGTDGADGNTDAAGAVVDGETMTRARSLGISPKEFLQGNNSYDFFSALDDLIVTGPTGTNVADIVLVLVRRSSRRPERSIRSSRRRGTSGTQRSHPRGPPVRRPGGRR